jgi:hypothetical protein
MAFNYKPNTTDWYGRWRLAADASNDYLIDRDAQQRDNYTGIIGIHLQDQAITESMGPIVDRTWENLAPSDIMIVRTRRRLAEAAQKLAEAGIAPPGVDRPEIYLRARSGDYITPKNTDWRTAYTDEIRRSANPTGQLQAAE